MVYKKVQLTALFGLFFFTTNECAQFNPSQHAQERLIDESIKTGFQIIGTQANDELSYRRTKNRVLTPIQQAKEVLNQKQQKLADVQTEVAEQQIKLTATQIQDAELDTFSKKYQITRSFYEGNKSKESDDVHERYRLKIQEMNKDLPELPTKETPETKKEDENTPAKKDKVGFFTKLATPFVFTLASAGQLADFLAGYSFAHATNLECFKGTVIETNSRGINRILVAATISALSYGGYKLYQKHYGADDDDDSLYNDDDTD